MGANHPNGEPSKANGKTNGNGNGHTNGNGEKAPYYRSMADCFIAYTKGYSLRWIAEHSQFNRVKLGQWCKEQEWERQRTEMDAERIKLYKAKCSSFDMQAIDRLQGTFTKVMDALDKRLDLGGPVYFKDLKMVVDAYKDIRGLNPGGADTGGGTIEQRVTVSLDPDDDDEDECNE